MRCCSCRPRWSRDCSSSGVPRCIPHFVEGAVSAFNLTNTTIQLLYLILAGWMANSATRYVGEEYRADEGRGLFSTVSTIYVGLCVLVAIGCCITAAVTQSPVYLGGALMFCTYTAFQVLNAALIQLGRVKASILWSLTSAVLKLAVAFALVGGKVELSVAVPGYLCQYHCGRRCDHRCGVCAQPAGCCAAEVFLQASAEQVPQIRRTADGRFHLGGAAQPDRQIPRCRLFTATSCMRTTPTTTPSRAVCSR